MTTAATVPPDVDAYLAAVRAELADLPPAERDDLLAEVESSLAESAADTAAPVDVRLGPPEAFAAELRAAAGLGEPATPSRPQPGWARRGRELARRAVRHPLAAAARRTATELAPIWWVARGYLLVAALALALDAAWSSALPFVPRFATGDYGLLAIVVGVVASVWFGLRQRRRGIAFPRVALAANLVLLAVALPLLSQMLDHSRAGFRGSLISSAPAPAPVPLEGVLVDGVPVDNIYPYSRDGQLLHDVLLYDGAGRPIEIRGGRETDPDRRFVVTNGNRPLFNVFPIRYYEPGTRQVARPNAAPYVELPLVRTPPLRTPER